MAAEVENMLGIGKLENMFKDVGKAAKKIINDLPDSYSLEVLFDIEGDTSAMQDDDILVQFRAKLSAVLDTILEEIKGAPGDAEPAELDALYEVVNKASASASWTFSFGIQPKEDEYGIPTEAIIVNDSDIEEE